MNRRGVLGGALALVPALLVGHGDVLSAHGPAGPVDTSEWVRPKRLQPGDTAAFLTPSALVTDPEDLAQAERFAAHLGLKARFMRHASHRPATIAEHIQQRVADLHEAYRDPDIKAILPLAGGYGAQQLLPHLDYDLITRNPKILAGYSDITALHVAIQQRCRHVTYHAPTPLLSGLSAYSLTEFRSCLFGDRPAGSLKLPRELDAIRPNYPLRAIREGRVEGRLVGGNLSLLVGMLGTPFEIDCRGCILILEAVALESWQVDAGMAQLAAAGKLRDCAGVLWATCRGCGPRDFRPARVTPFSVGESIDFWLGGLDVPVLSGMPFGHTSDMMTLALGANAILDVRANAALSTVSFPQAAVL